LFHHSFYGTASADSYIVVGNLIVEQMIERPQNSMARSMLISFINNAAFTGMSVGLIVFSIMVSFALKENQQLWFLAIWAVAIFSALTVLRPWFI